LASCGHFLNVSLPDYFVACEEPLFQASLIFVSEEEGFWMKAQRRVIHAIRRRKL
jgi:hypothetical protein